MSLFNTILEQLTKSLQGKELYKDEIVKGINTIIGINIKPDQIKIKENKIFINVSPTIKTVIYLKKQQILKALEKYKITTIG